MASERALHGRKTNIPWFDALPSYRAPAARVFYKTRLARNRRRGDRVIEAEAMAEANEQRDQARAFAAYDWGWRHVWSTFARTVERATDTAERLAGPTTIGTLERLP